MLSAVLADKKTTLRLPDIASESDLGDYNASVIVTSDTCYKEPKKDISGDFVVNSLKSMNFNQVQKHIVPDSKEAIYRVVKNSADDLKNILIITVGGTGLCPRDVTPEATSMLYEKNCPGISTALIMEGLLHSPHAALSRLTAGIYGHCLIVNFPGKTKACVECFGCLSRILGHALEQVVGDLAAVSLTHRVQEVEPHEAKDKTKVPISHSDGRLDKPVISQAPVRAETFDVLTTPPSPPISPPPRSKKTASTSIVVEAKPLESSKPLSTLSISLPNLKTLKSSSPYTLVDYQTALDIMGSLAYNHSSKSVRIVTLDSNETAYSILGEVLAEGFPSYLNIPPFSVSTMDGYVLNIPSALKDVVTDLDIVEAALVSGLDEFEKLQQDPEQCSSFFCYQVNTGGRVPGQNFAVIPVESTSGIGKETIMIARIEPGRYVRRPGSDLCKSDRLRAGCVIGPVELSILLSMGRKRVMIAKRPTIGILSTGDELVDFYMHDFNDKTKVINANGPLLTALFKKKLYPVVDLGTAKDNPRDILLKIDTGLKESDVLLITGGASVGSKDHVKDIVEHIGGVMHFGRVNIKPGKPAALASVMFGGQRKFIFCLPGNPVSAYITSLVLVLPLLERGLRNRSGTAEPLTMESIGDLISVKVEKIEGSQEYVFDGRLDFVRAKLIADNRVVVSAQQQSSRLYNVMDCNCLILADPSRKGQRLLVGQMYPALRLRDWTPLLN